MKPALESKLVRIVRVSRPYRLALMAGMTLALVMRLVASPSTTVVVERDRAHPKDARDVWPMATFHTANLIVDQTAGIGSGAPPAYAPASSNWIQNNSTTNAEGLIVEDGAAHTTNFNTMTIHNSGTLNVTAADRNAIGLRIVMDPLPAGAGHILNNAGLTIDTNNGDTNLAIHVIHGTTQLDEDVNTGALTSASAHVIGNFDVNTSKFTVDAATGNTEIIGLLNLSNTTESLWAQGRAYLGGTTKGDTVYVSSGSINFGFGNNFDDRLYLNFLGYNGGFSRFRDLCIADGKGNNVPCMAFFQGSTSRVGVNTNNPAAALDVVGAFKASGNTTIGAGAQVISGGAPSANHGSLSTGSTNYSGDITAIGANSSVVVTYSAAFTNRSRCIATPLNASVAVEQITANAGASNVTFTCTAITTGVVANCDDFTYECIGQ